MDWIISVLAVLAGVIGIIGSILPGLPGTPISWVGMLILYMCGTGTDFHGEPMSMRLLVIWGIITVIVSVVDYVIPMYFTKLTGGSKYAGRGAMVGLLVGIILTPIGMILGSFLGAFLAEMHWGKKDAYDAFKAALGSFLGFILGTGLKTIASVCIFWQILVYLV